MNLRRLAENVVESAIVALLAFSPHVQAQSIASAELLIQGSGLRVIETAVTTAIDVPTSIQTEFGGKQNEDAVYVEGLLVEGDLSGPALFEPITITTLPGQRLRIPGLPSEGVYTLSNIRLIRDGVFLQSAFPSVASITVANVLQTSVRVRQLTAEELRARGISLDPRFFDVYEYTFSFYVDGQLIEVPFPVYIDPLTREARPVEKEHPYRLPEDTGTAPPRWTPPTTIPTEFVAESEMPLPVPAPTPVGGAPSRPRIPAAIVIPNDFAVLHQFFSVALFVTNGAPAGSGITLDSVEATILTPAELRVNSTTPSVSFGRPVPIVDATNGVTLLVAEAEGEAKWILEGLRPGTHTFQFDLRATYRAPGQPDLRMKASPKASIVVHDPRFNINFSHPDTVRAGNPYTTYSFITNLSPAAQSIRVGNGVPSCVSNPTANVCRDASTPEFHELTLEAGEMRPIEYRLVSNLTGRIFATAGTVEGDVLTAAVQLHMGVSESGIPLSPATLVLPYYAQFLDDALLSDHLQLLGLGYSIATAPLNSTTAKFPRVIRTDVFARAVDLARAGQHVFIGASEHDVLLGLALDLTGNASPLEEWDELRRLEQSGRTASRALAARIAVSAPSGATPATIVDAFAAQAHRQPFLAAAVSGASGGIDRPYALSVRGISSNRKLDVPSEAGEGWVRQLPWAELNALNLGGLAGELAIVGRWSEDLEVVVTPAISGSFQLDLAWPGATPGTALRATMSFIGTAGEPIAVALVSGNPEARALSSSGAIVTTATATEVAAAPLAVVAARQDLHLDESGRLVSILFNRPIAPEPGLAAHFEGRIVFDGDGVHWEDSRPISTATPQPGDRIVNLGFDHILSTNASYTIAIDPLGDPLTGAAASIAGPIVPRIDNDAPAGIIYGRVLRADNTPVSGADVSLSIYSDKSKPFPASTQVVEARNDGSFLFESVRRDPERGYDGAYSLHAVDAEGKATSQSGAVRLPGRVQFVSVVYLGRGSAEGVVRYEDGTKVAGALVVAGSTMFSQVREAETDGNGFYRIADLPVGPLTLSVVDAKGNTVYAAVELKLSGQIVTKDLTIVRRPNPGLGSVSGLVRRSDTLDAVSAARVGVFSDGYAVGETYTGSDGRFSFDRVPAGFVTVLAADWSVSRTAAAADFDLAADATRELTLTLEIVPETGLTSLEVNVFREDPLNPGSPSHYMPAAGALIAVDGMGAGTADANGRFVFESIPLSFAGKTIKAWDPATSRTGQVSIPTLPVANPLAVLIPASGGTGTIRVKLLDAQGFPVSGYRVLVPGFPATVLEGAGPGVYELKDVRVGATETIWAVPHFESADNPSHGRQWTRGSVKVEFGGHVATLNLRLPGEGRVRVALRSDIDLIGDVAMRYPVWDELEQSLKIETETLSTSQNGVAGYATFEGVPALQQFTVASNHPVHGHASASGQLAFEGDLQTIVLQLDRLASVRGTVYEIDGVTPVAGASVRLSDGRQDVGSQLTATDGSFQFRNVAASTSVTATASVTRDGIYRTGFASARTPSDGGAVENLSVVLRRRGTVEGKVVYAAYKVFDPLNPSNNVPDDTPEDLSDNAPVPLAKFWMRELGFPARAFGSSLEPMTADAQGRFELGNIFEGSLRATAWDPGNQELRGDWSGQLVEEGERVQAIVAIGGEGVGALEVEVLDPNEANAPVVNAEVVLLVPSAHKWKAFDAGTTDGAGRARFEQLPPGDYTVHAYSKALSRFGSSGEIPVLANETSEARILLEFSGKVYGELVDPMAGGAGVGGSHVTLRAFAYETRTTTAPTTGAFSFDGVREGTFELSARHPDSNRWARATGALTQKIRELSVPLVLEPTETLYVQVDLPADDGSSSGVPAPSIGIDVTQAGIKWSIQGENPATIPGLLKDHSYSIVARERGGEQRQVKFSGKFPAGDATSPLRLVLPAFGSIRVTVAQAGAPATGARVRATGGSTFEAFTDASGVAVLSGLRLGIVSVQATSLDGNFSDSTTVVLGSQSDPAEVALALGAYAGVAGFVEAESGGPSIGTRVAATFSSRTLDVLSDSEGRFRFQGIPTSAGGTQVALTYIGPDEVTVGARQTVLVPSNATSSVVEVAPVRLDATPPQILSLTPADGATEVSPDSSIVVVFSEPIRADQLHNGLMKLIPADSSTSLSTIFSSSTNADGSFSVTMTPPAPPPGQQFRLASNTLFRITISADVQDATGNRLGSARGASFITSDYAEPRVIRTEPAATLPLQANASIRFIFNEPIDTATFSNGTSTLTASRLSGPGGTVTEPKPGNVFFDPAAPATILFAPTEPFAGESLYRFVIHGARDLQGNVAGDQSFEFFTFDATPPHVTLVSPLAAGESLVSGVEYTIVPEIRNGSAAGSAATDVEKVDWSRVEGSTDAFVYRASSAPWSYRFVAPEAPAEGLTLTIRAVAHDLSLNASVPADLALEVRPNMAPSDLALAIEPASFYPANRIEAVASFDDEGIVVTAEVELVGTHTGGAEYRAIQTKQVKRSSVADPWPPTRIAFDLPGTLAGGSPLVASLRVTDVRGLTATTSIGAIVQADSVPPEVLDLTPPAESRYEHGETFIAEATVRDLESGVAEVVFDVDGQTISKTAPVRAGVEPGSFVFSSGPILVSPKNLDTRIPVVVTAVDQQRNESSRVVEVIYVGVNDPTVPAGAWANPVDRAAYPAATNFAVPLRVVATDDIAVTGVAFEIEGIATPIAAVRVGTTDGWEATAILTLPAAGESLTITAVISDADPLHEVRMPVRIEAVDVDFVIDDRIQAILESDRAAYEGKSILVRGTNAILVPHIAIAFRDLLVLDGARVETLPSTTTVERKLDLTIERYLHVDSSSAIDVTAKGYLGGWGEHYDGSGIRNEDARGRTEGNLVAGGAEPQASASHAGLGGLSDAAATNDVYGDLWAPSALGAGGGGASSCCMRGGAGGGVISIARTPGAANALFAIGGTVAADGESGVGHGGAGAGGSIRIEADSIVTGVLARVRANGGDDEAFSNGSAGAGGGRVAIAALLRFDLVDGVAQARGGRNSGSDIAARLGGGAGTIVIERPGSSDGALVVSSLDERYATTLHQTRATPLYGDALVFDALTVGPRALLRFDDTVTVAGLADNRSTMSIDPSAVVLLAADVPSLSVTTAPPADSTLIQATTLAPTYEASSLAGIGSVRFEWSLLAQPRLDLTPAYPPTLAPAPVALQVPHDAAPGAATLRLVAEDRAGRSVSSETLAYTIVENAPPEITGFDATPLSLYPGATATLVAVASDDVEITTLTLRALIGETEVKSQGLNINAVSSGDRVLTYTVPAATTGGQTLRFEAVAADGFPGRAPTVQTGEIAILVDTNPPSVSITKPMEGEVFLEGSGNTIDVSVAASDAEVAVKSVMAEIEGGSPATLALSGGVWIGKIPVPSVDGTADVPRTITATASDYAGNAATAGVGVFIRPHIDVNAPVVHWSCPTPGALFPSGHPVKLRVHALGNDVGGTVNGVDTVAFFVGDSETPIVGQPVAGMADYYESTTGAIVTGVEGDIVTIRAVVTNVGGIANQASTTVTIVEGIVVTADLTIDDANAATYERQTLIVSAGITTIVGARRFGRVIVLDGAMITHPATDATTAHSLDLGADRIVVACGGAIDVSGRGFPAGGDIGATWPGVAGSSGGAGGSHGGPGGRGTPGGTYGSVMWPGEPGGAGSYVWGWGSTGSGGGVIRIEAEQVRVDGRITAGGGLGSGATGAGGSVLIEAAAISGAGEIRADGGSGGAGGGGGRIALHYQTFEMDSGSISAGGGNDSAANERGAAGTVYLRRVDSAGELVRDELIVSNGSVVSSGNTDLPSVGYRTVSAVSGSTLEDATASMLAPDHLRDVRAVVNHDRAPTWPILANDATSLTIDGSRHVLVAAVGDSFRGLYRFDRLTLRNAKLTSMDLLEYETLDSDAVSTIAGNNQSLPVLDPARIVLQQGEVGAVVTGAANAVLDSDQPIEVIARNDRTGATFRSLVQPDGSFAVGIEGLAGDSVSVSARDGNIFPLESAPIAVGVMASSTPSVSDVPIPVSVALGDTWFRSRHLAGEGRHLFVWSGEPLSGEQVSDKLVLFDVSAPGAPVHRETLDLNRSVIQDVEVRGRWAYATSQSGMTRIDLDATPLAAHGFSGGSCTDLAGVADASYLFVASTCNGYVEVWDVTGMPAFVREHGTGSFGTYRDLELFGDAYLAGIGPGPGNNGSADIVVVDRRDIHALTHVTKLDIPGFTAWRGRKVGNDLLYLTDRNGKWAVVDMSDPAAPMLRSMTQTAGLSRGVVGSGTTGAVADGGRTVSLWDGADSDEPRLAGSADAGGSTWDVRFGQGVLYAANEGGIAILHGIASVPGINTALIEVEGEGGSARVVGSLYAVTGEAPLTVTVSNEASGAELSQATTDGSFEALLAAKPGDRFTVSAVDGSERTAGPLNVGRMPFGTGTMTLRIPASMAGGDTWFRSRHLEGEGRHLFVWSGEPLSGEQVSDKLVLFDVSVPGAPVHRETLDLNRSVIQDVEVRGRWAYATSQSGMTRIDLDATPLAVHGFSGGSCTDLAGVADASYLFVASTCNGYVEVWDVTGTPVFVREQGIGSFGTYRDLELFGDAYLAAIGPGPGNNGSADVVVVDRRDIHALTHVTKLDIPGFTAWRGRKVGNDLLYLTDRNGKWAVIDMSDPTAPALRSMTQTTGFSRGIAGTGSRAIVADGLERISLWDETAPEGPALEGEHSIQWSAWDVRNGVDVIYVASDFGLTVVTGIGSPPRIDAGLIQVEGAGDSARIVGATDAVTGEAPLTVTVRNEDSGAEVSQATADGGFDVLLAAEPGDRFTVSAVDGSGRTAGPVDVGRMPFGTGTTTLGIPASMAGGDTWFRSRHLEGEGRHLFVWSGEPLSGEQVSDKLVLFDVSVPGAPVHRETLDLNRSVIQDVEVRGRWAYATSQSGMTRIDLDATPLAVHGFSGGSCTDLAGVADASYLFVASTCNGYVEVWDVTGTPVFVREQGIGSFGTYRDLELFGDVYLAGIGPGPSNNGSADIVVIDRRNIHALAYVTKLDIPGFTAWRGRKVGNDLLYLTDRNGKWAVVDMSDPTAPVLRSVSQSSGWSWGISGIGSSAVVANRTTTIGFWDETDPAFPTLEGEHEVGWPTWDVRHHAGVLYVAADFGLAVIAGVPSPPELAVGRISVANDSGTVTVTGAVDAALGSSALTINASVLSGGTATAPADPAGTFSLTFIGIPGESITLTATDAEGRWRTISLTVPGPG